jgi:hypothetical protein
MMPHDTKLVTLRPQDGLLHSFCGGFDVQQDLMLPDSQHPPAGPDQACAVSPIPALIAFNLVPPTLGQSVLPSLEAEAMPEIPINKHHQSRPWEDEVGAAWETSDILAKPKPVPVKA